MEIETQYAVKLFFPNPAFVQVYFEAVANAFDAEATEVDIIISSDGQISPGHLEITIRDNGVGFTDDRFECFRRLTEPTDPHHRGLGRLVFLSYFSTVRVSSVYGDKKRTFTFSNTFKGKFDTAASSAEDKRGTELRFNGFMGSRLRSYEDIKPAALKEKLLEHFLPLFHEKKKTGKDFRLGIKLETKSRDTQKTQKELFPDEQFITASDVPTLESRTITDRTLGAFAEITMSYMLRQGASEQQLTAVCMDGRTIPIKLLAPNAIPLGHAAIFLFESDLFGKSDSARQRFALPETVSEAELFRVLRRNMSALLNEKLPEIEQKNAKTRKQFEDRYPHLTGLFEEDTVGIIDKDEAIEIAQRRFFRKQKEVLESASLDDATYQKSLEVSSRTLTEYILYRELIIKRLGEIDRDNKEADVHNLIVPRYRSFHKDGLVDGIYSNNAWLLDDKFMGFRTILSEATMREVIEAITLGEDAAADDGRPDVSMIFSADPASPHKVDVVVVEIKRRKPDDRENPYAATQLLKRAQKLAGYWPTIQRIWYFAIIEIDQALSQLLRVMKWTPLFSKGQVFYQDFQVTRDDGVAVPTPICLLSYDAVIQDASARNHTFLEILKNEMRRAKVGR